jgi:hypothetical protein
VIAYDEGGREERKPGKLKARKLKPGGTIRI